ncbi:MAG TPA: hypothetical protein VER17_09605 [Tepidisphaeraceae bacterium]|nr:hypothetical protein [Tepidisphaeraceae bacterium]
MRPRHPAASVESLESRRLLAASLAADGTLNVTGTAGNDVIAVALDGVKQQIKVVEGTKITWFKATLVKKISAMLGTGADKYDGTHASRPQTVDGEAGNDTIIGGTSADNLIGGLDNDSVTGNDGDDSLSGSGGRDSLDGGLGKDRIDGGSGNDTLRGGAHDDRMFGGAGSDIYYGDGGNDTFYSGGMYNDSLYGGSGTDSAYADSGDVLESVEVRLTNPPS